MKEEEVMIKFLSLCLDAGLAIGGAYFLYSWLVTNNIISLCWLAVFAYGIFTSPRVKYWMTYYKK